LDTSMFQQARYFEKKPSSSVGAVCLPWVLK
jgi:hypothetical protein